MSATQQKRYFPLSQAVLLHQNGTELSVPTTGVEITLHTRENESHPCCAEIVSGHHHAEIGLSFTGKKLCDYDGVFFLPHEVATMLRSAGYEVPDDFLA